MSGQNLDRLSSSHGPVSIVLASVRHAYRSMGRVNFYMCARVFSNSCALALAGRLALKILNGSCTLNNYPGCSVRLRGFRGRR